jgi:hypothetical protein
MPKKTTPKKATAKKTTTKKPRRPSASREIFALADFSDVDVDDFSPLSAPIPDQKKSSVTQEQEVQSSLFAWLTHPVKTWRSKRGGK